MLSAFAALPAAVGASLRSRRRGSYANDRVRGASDWTDHGNRRRRPSRLHPVCVRLFNVLGLPAVSIPLSPRMDCPLDSRSSGSPLRNPRFSGSPSSWLATEASSFPSSTRAPGPKLSERECLSRLLCPATPGLSPPIAEGRRVLQARVAKSESCEFPWIREPQAHLRKPR